MLLSFYKYQGTGNDFILLDNRAGGIQLEKEEVAALCHRRFGIGADGLMLLELIPGYDFKMVYYNSDGQISSMCGNGGRCIASFANQLGLGSNGRFNFLAVDGPHEAIVSGDRVELRMQDVKRIEPTGDAFFLNTGSPHYVKFVTGLAEMDVVSEGRTIRNSAAYREEGTNVNFMEVLGDTIHVRTYERGVEEETWSCGTGVTAAALVASATGTSTARNSCRIQTSGGELEVSFERVLEQNFYNIWLKGPALAVFSGTIETDHVYKRE
jgi:diaminopimelate epimerase